MVSLLFLSLVVAIVTASSGQWFSVLAEQSSNSVCAMFYYIFLVFVSLLWFVLVDLVTKYFCLCKVFSYTWRCTTSADSPPAEHHICLCLSPQIDWPAPQDKKRECVDKGKNNQVR